MVRQRDEFWLDSNAPSSGSITAVFKLRHAELKLSPGFPAEFQCPFLKRMSLPPTVTLNHVLSFGARLVPLSPENQPENQSSDAMHALLDESQELGALKR